MKKLYLLITLIICCWLPAQAQDAIFLLQSSESRSMGGSQAGAFGIQSLFGNPAGLAQVENFSAIVAAETRFAGSGILLGGAGAALPSELGVFGVSVGYFGLPEYNEQAFSVGYSRLLFKSFAISLQAQLYNFSIQDYGSQFSLSGTIGIQGYINESLTIGTYIRNPVRVSIIPEVYLPTILSIGGQYKFPEKLKILAAIEKDLDKPLSIQFGLEYAPVEKLMLRIGAHTAPEELTFGLAFEISERLRLDAMAAYHQVLGVSPGLSIIYK